MLGDLHQIHLLKKEVALFGHTSHHSCFGGSLTVTGLAFLLNGKWAEMKTIRAMDSCTVDRFSCIVVTYVK